MSPYFTYFLEFFNHGVFTGDFLTNLPSMLPKRVKCASVSVEMPWLNEEGPISFPDTWAGDTSEVNCPGESNEKIYKKCMPSGEWDSYTNSDGCNTVLSQYIQSMDKECVHDQPEMEELRQNMKKIDEDGSHTTPSPRDIGRIVDLLTDCTKTIVEKSSSDMEELSLNMIKLMGVLKKGQPDFLDEEKKSSVINILETVSMSVASHNPIRTKAIVVQSINSSEEYVNIEVPETIPQEDLPIKLDFGNQQGNRAIVAVMHQSFQNILPKPSNPQSVLGSPIVSLNFVEQKIGTKEEPKFSIIFQQQVNVNFTSHSTQRECVYLNVKTHEWLTDGCRTILHGSETCTCTCTHTTSFAVLLSPTAVKDPSQDIFSYVMFVINLTFMLLTFCLLAPFRNLRKKQAVLIQLNLILALILANISFTALSASSKIKVDESGRPLVSLNTGCVAGVIITQYFFLSGLSWMGCTAWNFFGKTVNAVKSYGKNDKFFFRKSVAVSWLLPVVPPVVVFLSSLAVNKDDYPTPYVGAARTNDSDCWVEHPWRAIGFMAPAYIVLLFNVVCFVMIARVIVRSSRSGSGVSNLAKTSKGLMMVAVSVGCPWIVIALAVGPAAQVMQYLFILLTGLQGPFLFIALILLQDDARAHTLALFGIQQAQQQEEQGTTVTRASVVVTNTQTDCASENPEKAEKD